MWGRGRPEEVAEVLKDGGEVKKMVMNLEDKRGKFEKGEKNYKNLRF